MALKDLFAYIDSSLKDVFHLKTVDPAIARRPLLRGIDRTLAQFTTGASGTAAGWHGLRNAVVALTVKVGGITFDVNGSATNHIPADRFEEFLTRMRAAVEAGEFDAELAIKGNGDAHVAVPRRASTISPEAAEARGIKAAASQKANRAKAAAT